MLELPSKFYFKSVTSQYTFKAEINPNSLDWEGNICYRVTWTDEDGVFHSTDVYSVEAGHEQVLKGLWKIVPDTETQIEMFEPEFSELGELI